MRKYSLIRQRGGVPFGGDPGVDGYLAQAIFSN